MTDAWACTAQYHDLLHGQDTVAVVRALIAPHPEIVRHGVLDVGAGTGLALAEAALLVPDVPILAVEPSPSMRAALFCRLVDDVSLRERTTVLPCNVEQLDVDGVADLVLCLGTSPCFPPAYRPDIWTALHRAMVTGGALILDKPEPSEPAVVAATELGRIRIGQYTLVSSRRGEPAGQRQWWDVTYTLLDPDEKPVAEESEEHYTWPVKVEELTAELALAGFALRGIRQIAQRRVMVLRRD